MAAALSITGCKSRQMPTQPSLVTQVRIQYACADAVTQWHFRTVPKVDRVLGYLHRLSFCGQARCDPEAYALDAFRIDLILSDGQTRTYRQRGDCFFSANCHRWQRIDPELGCRLLPLLEEMVSDP